MNVLTVAALALVVLGLGELAAMLGIQFRYAIPRAPWFFRLILFPPMLGCVASTLTLSWVALSGAEEVLGLDPVWLFAIYVVCQAMTFWTLVAYAVYHHLRGRRCPV